MSKKLKVAVIGVGGIAKTHMPGWAASPDAEVVAGADVSANALQEWGKTNGVTRLFADPYEAIHDPEIDVIDICVPNMFHAPLAIAALRISLVPRRSLASTRISSFVTSSS